MGGVESVAEDVDVHAVVESGNLNPRETTQAYSRGGARGRRDSTHRVVVGYGHGLDAATGALGDEVFRRRRAVRGRRMQMEIDHADRRRPDRTSWA